MGTLTGNASGELVVAFQATGSGIPLFLVDPGLEAVGIVRHLGSDHPVFGIRVPNLGTVPMPRRMEAIAAACARAVREQCPKGPYAFAGWCAAGFLGLEIARQLERGGASIAFVAMFDARTVHLPPMSADKRLAIRFWYVLQRFRFLVWRAHAQGRGPLRSAVMSRVEHARSFAGRDRSRAQAGAVNDAARAHQPAPWRGRIVHIWAEERPRGLFRDPQFVCGFLSPEGYKFYEVPGDRISMLAEPRVAEVSRILAAELDRAGASQAEAPFRRSPAFS